MFGDTGYGHFDRRHPGNARTSLPPWPERGSLPPSGRLAIAGVEIVELLLEGLVNRFLFREPVVAGPRVVSRQNTRTEHVASSVRWKTLICGKDCQVGRQPGTGKFSNAACKSTAVSIAAADRRDSVRPLLML